MPLLESSDAKTGSTGTFGWWNEAVRLHFECAKRVHPCYVDVLHSRTVLSCYHLPSIFGKGLHDRRALPLTLPTRFEWDCYRLDRVFDRLSPICTSVSHPHDCSQFGRHEFDHLQSSSTFAGSLCDHGGRYRHSQTAVDRRAYRLGR